MAHLFNSLFNKPSNTKNVDPKFTQMAISSIMVAMKVKEEVPHFTKAENETQYYTDLMNELTTIFGPIQEGGVSKSPKNFNNQQDLTTFKEDITDHLKKCKI